MAHTDAAGEAGEPEHQEAVSPCPTSGRASGPQAVSPSGQWAVAETQEPEEAPLAHIALCGPHRFSADHSPSPCHSIPSLKGICLGEDSGKTRDGSNEPWASGKLGMDTFTENPGPNLSTPG